MSGILWYLAGLVTVPAVVYGLAFAEEWTWRRRLRKYDRERNEHSRKN